MLIGLDVGGSKNDLVLCTNDGRALRRLLAEGSNVSEMGADAACDRMVQQVQTLLEQTNCADHDIDGLVSGLSGGGNMSSRKIVTGRMESAFPGIRHIMSTSDIATALYAGVGAGDGMVIIAGTGTSAMTRCGESYSQTGGWGHLIDDAGSGFWLGKEALNAALRQLDGRGPETLLTELVNRRLGANVRSCIPQLYSGGKRTIAAYAPLVFEAAQAGDAVALDIFRRTADELALLIRASAAHLKETPYRVALTGSIWRAAGLQEAVSERLGSDYQLSPLEVPQVCGAVLAAAELAALRPDDSFRARLAESLTELS